VAVIHNTTLRPGKLQLLAAWLPSQPWYLDTGQEPELVRVGGFRLDDPAGDVGIEFMLVRDDSGGQPATYQVPMTYRPAARDSSAGLIGTSEHGVLGLRWIYDAAHDPVMVAQMVALLQGSAQAQMQSQSDTADPTVTGVPVPGGALDVLASAVTVNGPDGTELLVETAGSSSPADGQLIVRISRVLTPADTAAALEDAGTVAANWVLADDTAVRGVLAAAQWTSAPRPRV
jgi:hypothetical protein